MKPITIIISRFSLKLVLDLAAEIPTKAALVVEEVFYNYS